MCKWGDFIKEEAGEAEEVEEIEEKKTSGSPENVLASFLLKVIRPARRCTTTKHSPGESRPNRQTNLHTNTCIHVVCITNSYLAFLYLTPTKMPFTFHLSTKISFQTIIANQTHFSLNSTLIPFSQNSLYSPNKD